jgi:hypothetical protein
LAQAHKLQLDNAAQKPIVETREDVLAQNTFRKVQFGGVEKLGVPYKTHPIKAVYNPYIRVDGTRGSINSKQKNEFHYPKTAQSKPDCYRNSSKTKDQSTLTTP